MKRSLQQLLDDAPPYTDEMYNEALADIACALSQREPDGRPCMICEDTDHQAFECRHNPLIMMKRGLEARLEWRCFHCGVVFTDEEQAKLHFGHVSDEYASCERMTISGMRNDFARIKNITRQMMIGMTVDGIPKAITQINIIAMKHGHGVQPVEELSIDDIQRSCAIIEEALGEKQTTMER